MKTLERGKRAIMFEYLPGKTFDYGGTGVIAQTIAIRGRQNNSLNYEIVFHAIAEKVRAWPEEQRKSFPIQDYQIDRVDDFVFLEPNRVEAAAFPLVFWCQNNKCNRVFEYRDQVPASSKCPECSYPRIIQIRWVRVHRCGHLLPLSPYCRACRSNRNQALLTRGSERIRDFRWECKKCGRRESVFGGPCPACDWQGEVPNVRNPKLMDIEVHRAGRTYYPHYAVLLNHPTSDLDKFLRIENWQAVVTAKYLGMAEVSEKKLSDFSDQLDEAPRFKSLSEDELRLLRERGASDQQISEYESLQRILSSSDDDSKKISNPTALLEIVTEQTSIEEEALRRAGYELLEAIMPYESGKVERLSLEGRGIWEEQRAKILSERAGIADVDLITDFPITTAVFGFSRTDYRPGLCRINPFPPDREQGGSYPIFVDTVHADAIMVKLDPRRIALWLEANKVTGASGLSNKSIPEIRAHFINVLDEVELSHAIPFNQVEARMLFGLLHSFSHISMRHAALLCGLDRTSLAEYVLPRSLAFAIYSSNRFGATIGAFTALYEQSLEAWLGQIIREDRCVYDPVCETHGGSCHACMHSAEISCQYFNMNLSRSFLYGGFDARVGAIRPGYLHV